MISKQTYVALAGNSGSRSVVIGTGTTVTYRNIAYTDVSLSNDIDYYVFVRLFNNVSQSVCLFEIVNYFI